MSTIKFNFEKNSKVKICQNDNKKIDNEEENIGNCLDDFLILDKLDQGLFGTIFKVKSKRNKIIYVMKKIKKLIEKQENKKKHPKVEILILKKLNHPNIVKLFTYFEDNKYYYAIIEYINGPNLFDLYMSYKIKHKLMEEKFLWDLLGQCLDAITYIHGCGVIHRNIKLSNILLDEKNKLKIIDFNQAGLMDIAAAREFSHDKIDIKNIIISGQTEIKNSLQVPEINKANRKENNYDAKVDIYTIGKVFYALCKINNNISNYSCQLQNLINLMLIPNPEHRKTSNEIYKIYKNDYYMKYLKYTSIFSCLHCLFNYPTWEENLKNLRGLVKDEFSKSFFSTFKTFNNNYKDFQSNVFGLISYKLKMLYDNTDTCQEIDPLLFIKYIMDKLNEELNEIKEKCENFKYPKKEDLKEANYINYKKRYEKNIKSIITENFFGLFELKTICERCATKDYFFNHFYIIEINIENLIEQNIKLKEKNIFCAFTEQKIKRKIFCKKCQMETSHEENRVLFNVPNNLIIYFNKKKRNQNIINAKFPEILVLDDKYVEAFMSENSIRKKNYYLYSILCEIYDEEYNPIYISFTKKKENQNEQNNNYRCLNLSEIESNFNIIGLFYYSNKDGQLYENYYINSNDYKVNVCEQNEGYIKNKNIFDINYIINNLKINMENINNNENISKSVIQEDTTTQNYLQENANNNILKNSCITNPYFNRFKKKLINNYSRKENDYNTYDNFNINNNQNNIDNNKNNINNNQYDINNNMNNNYQKYTYTKNINKQNQNILFYNNRYNNEAINFLEADKNLNLNNTDLKLENTGGGNIFYSKNLIQNQNQNHNNIYNNMHMNEYPQNNNEFGNFYNFNNQNNHYN